jgi:hypothetical protein
MSAHLATRFAPLTLATALALTAVAPAAVARSGVYAGDTKGGDPIVLTTDAAGQKLTGAVFRIRVDGKEDWWPLAGSVKVRPATADPHSIPTGTLNTDRNGKGRFAAKLVTQLGSGATMAGIELKGTLKAATATGTIKGWVTVTDATTGELSEFAQTKTVKWTAERAAGRVYGGATAARLPIVVKLNKARTAVTELSFACLATDTTPPGMFWSASERLQNFPVHAGRFGDAWDYAEDGSTFTYHYDVAGRVTATTVKGTVAITSSGTDESGAATGFRMPATRFTATSG